MRHKPSQSNLCIKSYMSVCLQQFPSKHVSSLQYLPLHLYPNKCKCIQNTFNFQPLLIKRPVEHLSTKTHVSKFVNIKFISERKNLWTILGQSNSLETACRNMRAALSVSRPTNGSKRRTATRKNTVMQLHSRILELHSR